MSHYLQINGQRRIDTLYALGEHGALPGGGVCRLAATAEDKAGRDFVVARMKALGLLEGAPLARSGDAQPVVEVTEAANRPVRGGGKQCPECGSMSLHKVDGCERCDACGHIGTCG